MALPAICSQQRVEYLGAERPRVGCSELACSGTCARRQLGWSKSSKAAGLSLRKADLLSSPSGRPQYLHCISARQDDERSHRSTYSPQARPSDRPVHLRSLHRCSALPASVVEEDEEERTPWEGAVMFRRSAVQTQFDYETSLERLGLSRLSSKNSSSLATSMGLKISGSDGAIVTPVQISVEVTKEGRDFRLDGIIRTALALVCNRCLAPVAERVFATFSVLLTESSVNEPVQQTLGVVLGADHKIWRDEAKDDGDAEAELDIDLDDKLHFPRDAKELDLSKYLRDTIHLEIPSKSLCDSACKGLCIGCGVNLNNATCSCGKQKKSQSAAKFEDILGTNRRKDIWGPLEQLKKQLEEQQGGQNEPL